MPNKVTEESYIDLNARLNLWTDDKKINFDVDKEAVRQYHLQHVNTKTQYFPSIEDKLDYLYTNDYYEREVFEVFDSQELKKLYKYAYSFKHRFATLLGAMKFYQSYALKSFDGETYLERFEDRVVANAVGLSYGDFHQAKVLIEEIITGRLQPATPTFANLGKKQRGELVSCFPGWELVDTINGRVRIEDIQVGDKVLTHTGKYKKVTEKIVNKNQENLVHIAITGSSNGLTVTKDHPILVVAMEGDDRESIISTELPSNNFKWVRAGDVHASDYVVMASPKEESDKDIDVPTYRVKDISQSDIVDTVYNLEVEDDHTYSVNGFIVHNCFILDVQDNMESIGKVVNSSLQLSKRGGGVGINISNIREMGAPIKKIKGQSSGVLPVCKLLDDSFTYANQLGQRQGAGAVYINVHHPDLMRVLDSKRENADEKVRLKTLSVGLVVTDVAYQKAKENDYIYQFSPYDVEREYGIPFSKVDITKEYENLVNNASITKTKIRAREMFTTIAELQFQSGYPYIMNVDTVNRENPIDGKVDVSNLCVTGGTEILTSNGYRKVKDLYDSQEDFDVVVDTRARDMDLDKLGTSVEKSTRMFKTAENANILKMTTVEGHELRATDWHKMYVVRDKKLIKIPLNEVVPGDKVLVQSDEGSFGSIEEKNLAYVAGVLASDGTIAENDSVTQDVNTIARLYLYGDKKEFSNVIQERVWDVLEGHENLLNKQATLTPQFNEVSNSHRHELHSSVLAKILKSYGMSKDTKTKVPEFVLRGSKETQKAYLSGMFQLDATITGSVKSKVCSIELGSVDLDHLKQIQRILLNFGIYTRIFKVRSAGTNMLPDGKGGLAPYDCKQTYSLRASSSADRIKLFNIVEWSTKHSEKWEELGGGREVRTKKSFHKHLATVAEIVADGVEDVYDVTVENGNSVIFNGIATGNCSEILQVSEPSILQEDGSYEFVGRDISCNLASLHVKNVMDGGNIGTTVDTAIRALTNVSDRTSMNSVPSVKKGNELSHSVGLGQFALHTFFIQEGMQYGDENSLNFTNNYFMTVNYYTLLSSNQIAKERNETFYGFEKSKYASAQYLIDRYAQDGMINPNKNTLDIFNKYGMTIPTFEDWERLAFDIEEFGLYHAYRQAVAPTGSISYLNSGTSSVHPAVDIVETRKEGKTGRVYYPTPGLTNDNFRDFKDAYELGPFAIIDVYAEAQKHVDQGMSLTLFYKDSDTTRNLNRAYAYAHSKGIKTLYYARVRSADLAGTEYQECVSCAV